MKSSRPYKYSSKDRITKKSDSKTFKKQKPSKSEKNIIQEKKEKENETISNDEFLDTSFLENRIEQKKPKNKNIKKKLIAQGNHFLKEIDDLKHFFLSFGVVCLAIFLILLSFHHFKNYVNENDNKNDNKMDILMKKNSDGKIVDYNYLFVGDFYTEKFPFEYFNNDYHYVKVSSDSMSLYSVLTNLKSMIYDYNPSIIFLELGYIDLENGCGVDDFINQYKNLLVSIKENRPYAKIYVESIYPGGLDHDLLMNVNQQLEKTCNEMDISYIDVYSSFVSSGKMDSYLGNRSLSPEGYQALYQIFQKELD